MLSRRSLFSFFAGVGTAITGAKVVEAKPSPTDINDLYRQLAAMPQPELSEAAVARFKRMSRHFANAKGMSFTPMPRAYLTRGTIVGMDHSEDMGGGSYTLISDGVHMLPIDSDEGQRILNESAVNVRADGSIRHRQHHPVDFPSGGARGPAPGSPVRYGPGRVEIELK